MGEVAEAGNLIDGVHGNLWGVVLAQVGMDRVDEMRRVVAEVRLVRDEELRAMFAQVGTNVCLFLQKLEVLAIADQTFELQHVTGVLKGEVSGVISHGDDGRLEKAS